MTVLEARGEWSGISVETAKRFASNQDCDQIIILAWNREANQQWITTYGKSVEDSDMAAQGGNFIKSRLLGWPQSDACAIPDRVARMRLALEFYAAQESEQRARDLLAELFPQSAEGRGE